MNLDSYKLYAGFHIFDNTAITKSLTGIPCLPSRFTSSASRTIPATDSVHSAFRTFLGRPDVYSITREMGLPRLRIDSQSFRDPHNREITLRGINVAGDAKYPKTPDVPSFVSDHFFEGDTVSFVGRPFSLDDAHKHFARLRGWGYNTIRYIFTWEAIEHAGPGIYDDEWISFTIEVLRVAKQYGFYIFLDPHQDVWSRFSGGSGAPLWTLYAAGLNPLCFKKNEAALVHNTYDDPAEFPKMVWSTNYARLVNLTMWTLFFGGRDFAPKAIINGINIQDYLQGHFIAACRYFAQKNPRRR